MRNHAIKLPTDRNQILSYLFHEIFFFLFSTHISGLECRSCIVQNNSV